ncbi:hypothetical protein [Aurantimonas sp. VKM B-3413]|uniref:hypothetical protein n=1 Tax=Aurantimonas sp. VKM B-3413 TaxID=2779401 RepID=UPI001E604757|nr:hypothetical protein [Aurantimonas sp. VKM B-3413]MCB8837212.1 hypothetical protein [Aurantimonas sp. VKM B-3413]
MFDRFAKTLLIVAALATGGVAATAAPAAAAGPTIEITGDIHLAGHRHHRRDHVRGPACSPRQAVHKAHRLGLRRTHIRRVNRRVIAVAGRFHHRGHAVVRFARVPGCPVLGFRR